MAEPENIKVVDLLIRQGRVLFSDETTLELYHADIKQIRTHFYSLSPRKNLDTSDSPLLILEQLIQNAIDKKASDIHFQPDQHHVGVRFRIDGVLQSICVIHTSQWPQILNRLKVFAHLDIAETRRPQSGHFLKSIHSNEIDIRVSSHPTYYGENIVLRLMNKEKRIMTLEELGFPEKLAEDLKRVSCFPQGLIILTGPTGAGKTTTLYALLSSMDSKSRNIMTLEAPIEAVLNDIRQTEIREHNQLSYSDGVRSLMRQDPDVILIGEIRDEETAKMALRAVLTGHLVLSTLHTQDVLGVPGRLIDLGLPPVLLAGALQAVLAQRLVRKICKVCYGRSCEECTNGFSGRIVIIEQMIFDEEFNAVVTYGGDRVELEKIRLKRNIPTLWDHGIDLVNKKITTEEELTRVLGPKPKTHCKKDSIAEF
jgi:type II secretory ATPase GspE/PulE/Tfp pilus assembly ATPase PilB-like protein